MTGADIDPRIERSRRRVLEAAVETLAEDGYGAFTIEAVADRSGVARSTIYRHWPGRLELIADAFESLSDQPEPGGGPAARDVEELLRHLAEVLAESRLGRCLPALIEGAQRSPDVARFLHGFSRRRGAALERAIGRAADEGALGEGVDPARAATALAGAIFYRRLMTDRPMRPEEVGGLVEQVLGRRLPPDSPPR